MKSKVTDSEMAVLSLMEQGRSIKEIVEMKKIQKSTVKTLLQRAYRALEVHCAKDAIKKLNDWDDGKLP